MGIELPQYTLKWNDYESHVAELWFHMLEAESMVDVTLCVEGQHINAHRIVLSTCSSLFQDILSNCCDPHPYITLSEMRYEDVKSIIEFVYTGEINLSKDHFASVLKTAEDLRINGLMEVACYWADFNKDDSKEVTLEVWDAEEGTTVEETAVEETAVEETTVEETTVEETAVEETAVEDGVLVNQGCNLPGPSRVIEMLESPEILVLTEKDNLLERAKIGKKFHKQKEYTDAALATALEELRAGKPVQEVAEAHHIPRSTLYMRARSQNISVVSCRGGYSGERVQAALQAISNGASLQQASRLYKIPKTVLWRRVHKEVGKSPKKRRRNRDIMYFERKKAAIVALERGEDLCKVSAEYEIPKTYLLRQRSRLVQCGKLPPPCRGRRPSETDSIKAHRLNEAVAACREGKMSQASASQRYQVPKTTIWRRLKDVKAFDPDKSKETVEIPSETDSTNSVIQAPVHPVFAFPEVTYIDEADFSDSSLIILAANEGTEINLQDNNNLLVDAEVQSANEPGNEEVIECSAAMESDTADQEKTA